MYLNVKKSFGMSLQEEKINHKKKSDEQVVRRGGRLFLVPFIKQEC